MLFICENSIDLATNGEKKTYFFLNCTTKLHVFVKEKQSQNFELYKYLKSLLNVKKGNM